MKILILDYCCNSVDFARRLARENCEIELVYLMSDWVCPKVWKTTRLEFLKETMVHSEILQRVKALAVDLVINFNSLLGSAGLLEYLAVNKVTVCGSNKAFSETEINKWEFKRWLLAKGFPTPPIQFEGLMVDVLSQASRFNYPVAIKPDIQAGPPIRIVESQSQLNDYMLLAKKDFPQAELGIVFIIEDEIPSEEVVQIHYVTAGGKAYITHSIKALFGPKLPGNKLGALVAVSPWQGLDQYQPLIVQLLSELAKTGAASIGTLQCMVDADQQLYVIENNARPAACNVYDDWSSLSQFVQCLSRHDTQALESNQLFINKPRVYTVGMPLIHKQQRYELAAVEFEGLITTGIHPFALVKSQGYFSSSASMPSILIVGGDSPLTAVNNFNVSFSAARSWLPFEEAVIDASIFS